MASDKLQKCKVHHGKVAFARAIRGNFYKDGLGMRDVVVKRINKQKTDENMTKNITEKNYRN